MIHEEKNIFGFKALIKISKITLRINDYLNLDNFNFYD